MSGKAVNAPLPSQMEMQAAATKVAEGGLATEGTGGAAAESHLCQVPIAAVTADVMKGTKELCLQAGMSDYLPKPLNQKQLQELLERLLDPRGSLRLT
jgi:CheY-like chemotaxis protein